MFHRRDLATAPGPGLPPDIAAAITATTTVVGVVLNAVDDVLHGDQPDSGRWGIDDVPGLRALIDHAGRAGRPVILTSDHGHVPEYGESEQRATGTDARCRPRDGTRSTSSIEPRR